MHNRISLMPLIVGLGWVGGCGLRGTALPYSTAAGREPLPDQYVRMQGCVQPGSASDRFVLRDVIVPTPAAQPRGEASVNHPAAQNGDTLPLVGPADLKRYVGKFVDVRGNMHPQDRVPTGTSGTTASAAEPQDGASHAVSVQTTSERQGQMELAIEHIKELRGSCTPSAGPSADK
jgi:hypothetical protein